VATTKSSKRSTAAADGKVTLKLAHPIGARYQTGLGLTAKDEGADYAVGEDIDVYPHVARAIINAGFAQVDPEDPKAVATALGISDEAAEAVVAEMSGTVAPDTPAAP
jgi:hypothetical protein